MVISAVSGRHTDLLVRLTYDGNAKGRFTVLGNTLGLAMDCSDLYRQVVVLWPKAMPRVVLWPKAMSSMLLQSYVMPSML